MPFTDKTWKQLIQLRKFAVFIAKTRNKQKETKEPNWPETRDKTSEVMTLTLNFDFFPLKLYKFNSKMMNKRTQRLFSVSVFDVHRAPSKWMPNQYHIKKQLKMDSACCIKHWCRNKSVLSGATCWGFALRFHLQHVPPLRKDPLVKQDRRHTWKHHNGDQSSQHADGFDRRALDVNAVLQGASWEL